jgi:hypothetical protein
VEGVNNSTTLVADDVAGTVALNGINMSCFNYTLPICINSYVRDRILEYNTPPDFQRVWSQPFYAEDMNTSFFRNFFTNSNVLFTNWKIDFSLTTSGIPDAKGFACYINFTDKTGAYIFTPRIFNLDRPFTQYTSFSPYDNHRNFVWTDICDFIDLVGLDSDTYLPLNIDFYVRYDTTFSSTFNWSVGLTRTTIDRG